MTTRRRALVTALLIGAFALEGIAAQSLGDIARQEAERRKQATSGKQYTNDNLHPEPQPSSSGVPTPAPSTASTASVNAATTQPAPASDSKSAAPQNAADASKNAAPPAQRGREKRDETYWRARAGELRGRVQQVRQQIEAIQARVEELDTQLQAGAAPAVGREREVAATTLGRLQRNLQSFIEEVQRFEQRAQLEKVPAEWIR